MLIEILIALAILSLGLVMLIQSMSAAIKTTSRSLKVIKAKTLAESKLAQIQPGSYGYGISQGDFSDSDYDFTWEIETRPAFEHVDKISLKVQWPENNEKKGILVEILQAKK